MPDRTAQRGQVHPDQRAGRREGRDHQRPPADDAARDPGHRAPPGRAAHHRGHSRAAPPADPAGERLDSLVRSTLSEVDVIGFCVPANDPIGPGDKYLARELENVKSTPVVAIVTKTDEAPPERVAEQLLAISQLGDWADIVPVSAGGGHPLR